MFTPFVSDEKPMALYEGAPPQYTTDGLAIDCALVLHVLRGTAVVRCNLETIEERAGSVVLFNPGDTIKVEQRSADKLCITPRYLTGIVQSHYGKNPKEAIDIYTVMQIRLDLLQSDLPLADLVFKYNFSSPSFFSDYFHRNAGCTPQEYRCRNGELS